LGRNEERGEADMAVKKAKAVWTGTGKDGSGRLTSESGVLSDTAYSFKTRFENEKGTNPEELIAAAHAGCFAMALAFALQKAGLNPTSLTVDAAVSLDPDGDGFKVSKSALILVAEVPGVEKAKFDELAEGAKKGCPISKLLNAEITLDATLKS
jgi:osmotically inducible protein OsmC